MYWIRTPSTLYNEDTGSIHVVARCCGINQCSGMVPSIHRRRLDNDEDAKVIMKTSTDGGATWGKFQISQKARITMLTVQVSMTGIGNALLFSIIIFHKDQQPQFLILHCGKFFLQTTDNMERATKFVANAKNCNPNINNMEVQTAEVRCRLSQAV